MAKIKKEISLGKNWQSRSRSGQGEAALAASISDILTRQRIRLSYRKNAFKRVTKDYGPELRANRRRMSMRMARRAYQVAVQNSALAGAA